MLLAHAWLSAPGNLPQPTQWAPVSVVGRVAFCVVCSWPRLRLLGEDRALLSEVQPVSWALGQPASRLSQHMGLPGHAAPTHPAHVSRPFPGSHTWGRDPTSPPPPSRSPPRGALAGTWAPSVHCHPHALSLHPGSAGTDAASELPCHQGHWGLLKGSVLEVQCSRQGERAETSSSPLLGTHVLAAGELLEEGLWCQSPHASLARAVQTPEPPPLLGRPMGTEWAGLGQRGPRWGRFPGSPHGPSSVPQTQPVPNPVAYFLHRSPWWVHRIETLGNHFLELVVPFFVFLGRRMCVLHGVLQILFQVSLSPL